MAYIINAMNMIQETATVGVLILDFNVTDDSNSETYDTLYTYDPNDLHGGQLYAALTDWLAANPEFPRVPYEPPPEPTIEEIRAAMQPLTRRQFRLGLIDHGILPIQAQAIIDAMPSGTSKEKFKVEWNDGDIFYRLSDAVLTMTAALLLTPEQVDALWTDNANT